MGGRAAEPVDGFSDAALDAVFLPFPIGSSAGVSRSEGTVTSAGAGVPAATVAA
jgi:hypothetical protein